MFSGSMQKFCIGEQEHPPPWSRGYSIDQDRGLSAYGGDPGWYSLPAPAAHQPAFLKCWGSEVHLSRLGSNCEVLSRKELVNVQTWEQPFFFIYKKRSFVGPPKTHPTVRGSVGKGACHVWTCWGSLLSR